MRPQMILLLVLVILIIVTLGQKNILSTNEYEQGVPQQKNVFIDYESYNENSHYLLSVDNEDILTPASPINKPDITLPQIFSSALFFMLTGWAFGWVLKKFRGLILVFFGLYIICSFIIMQSNLITFRFHWDHIMPFFESIRLAIFNIGLASSLSLLFGLWIGAKGFSTK